MSETALVRSILQRLTVLGVWCWRVNAGLTVIGSGKARRAIKGAPQGSPDIMGIVPRTAGRLFGLEAKTTTGTIRASQKRWAEKATARGVRYEVVRSVDDAIGAVERWAHGESVGGVREGRK